MTYAKKIALGAFCAFVFSAFPASAQVYDIGCASGGSPSSVASGIRGQVVQLPDDLQLYGFGLPVRRLGTMVGTSTLKLFYRSQIYDWNRTGTGSWFDSPLYMQELLAYNFDASAFSTIADTWVYFSGAGTTTLPVFSAGDFLFVSVSGAEGGTTHQLKVPVSSSNPCIGSYLYGENRTDFESAGLRLSFNLSSDSSFSLFGEWASTSPVYLQSTSTSGTISDMATDGDFLISFWLFLIVLILVFSGIYRFFAKRKYDN